MKSNLIKYLPLEIRKIDEFVDICKTENLEFDKIKDLYQKSFMDSFIETASEYGLSRLEYISGLTPAQDDSLEDRRFRLYIKYNLKLPYTWKTLTERLDVLTVDGDYDIFMDFNNYTLTLNTRITTASQYNSLKDLLDSILPCNILVKSSNTLRDTLDQLIYTGHAIVDNKSYKL